MIILMFIFSSSYFAVASGARPFSWKFANQNHLKDTDGNAQIAKEANDNSLTKLILKSDNVSVDSDWLTVGDVFHCQGLRESCKKANRIKLCDSPKNTKKKEVLFKMMKDKLQSNTKKMVVNNNGIEKVFVKRLHHEVTKDKILIALRGFLDHKFILMKDAKIRVEAINLPRRWYTLSPDYDIKFKNFEVMSPKNLMRELVNRYKYGGLLQVSIIPREYGDQESSMTLKLRVSVLKNAYVAKEIIRKNSRILKGQVLAKLVKIKHIEEEYITDLKEILEKVAKTSIGPGHIFRKTDLSEPIAVQRGKIVAMKMGSGGYSLIAQVRAKQSGRVGEIIDVVYEPTRAKIRAKILSNHTLLEVEQ